MTSFFRSTLFVVLVVLVAVALAFLSQTEAGATGQEKTTICHPVAAANGGNTHAGYSIITTANPSVHIDEATGAPKHEHDGRVDFVVTEGTPCPPVTQESVQYRVVAGMPRYRGEVFEAPAGLTCTLETDYDTSWTAYCGEHVDSGSIGAWGRTYVRLRQVGVAGPAQVLLDLR